MVSYRVELLPDSDPLENFWQFLCVLGELHDEELAHENADVSAFLNTLADWGKNAIQSARQLFPVEQMTTLSVLNTFIGIEERQRKALLENGVVRRAIEYALIEDAYRRVERTKDRLPQIIGVVREVERHGASAMYLRELGDLYLNGNDIAVVLLARSALDEMANGAIEVRGLQETFEDWWRSNRPEQYPSLSSRLQFLRHDGVLTQGLYYQAEEIRHHGNWAAHEPDRLAASSLGSIDIVKRLAAVMKVLGKSV